MGDDGKWRGRREKEAGREKEGGGGKSLRNRREREQERNKEPASLRDRTQSVCECVWELRVVEREVNIFAHRLEKRRDLPTLRLF